MILDNEDNLFKMTLEDGTEVDRPLYFCHVDGLNAKKFKAHELTEEQIQAAPLRDVIPQGAVLIVDEAHYTYPVRAAARGVPPYIQELTELRHHGHTVILMTQHPSQLDIFVRNLVSKHTHIERKAIGLFQHTAARTRLGAKNKVPWGARGGFNSQPPEGGSDGAPHI